MPILEGFNPFSWDQKVEQILSKEKKVLFELEPHSIKFGTIQLITDEQSKIHIYANGKPAIIGGISSWHVDEIRMKIEEVDKRLHKKYKFVKIEAFVPFWFLKRLYLPDFWKPYKKSRKKRII